MRFSQLSLERYGHFEDCELDFRSGSPDFHIIYGGNEAGKSTSLAAVSDLLFGFPTRSPYNFIFDYPLLRVGAILQDGENTLTCRRKKGTSRTLLDAHDVAIDEELLRAMLKGQTRETFGLSFSLGQAALRKGGRAMVEAQDDVGRTLFAAGSGLTGISDELKSLQAAADGIWGPTTKGSRSFTQAQRLYAEAAKTVRAEALKPKVWLDAKAESERTRTALEAAQSARDAVREKLSTAERIRRLLPLVREREAQRELLETFDGVLDLGRQREDAAELLIKEADEAVRRAAAAELLRSEIAERRSEVPADPSVFEKAEEIDQLIAESGAVSKAAQDLIGLKEQKVAATARVAQLRAEAGSNADAVLERAVAAKLRDLARSLGELRAASRQISESREAIEERRRRALTALEAHPAEAASEALFDAIDVARALGTDADGRVEGARRKSKAAAADVEVAIRQLTPWGGGIDQLVILPIIGERETEEAREALAELKQEIRREEDEARRSGELAAVLALEIDQIATGTAVSPDEVLEARRLREVLWSPIRHHVLEGRPLPEAGKAVADFEAGVADLDEKVDRRFNFAEASSSLSMRAQKKVGHELEASQAAKRAMNASDRHKQMLEAWLARLTEVGLPSLEPSRFQTWQADRLRAEKLNSIHQDLLAEAAQAENKRDAALKALASALGLEEGGGQLAPVLRTAERRRAVIEEAGQKRRIARSELDQVEIEAEALDRRQQKLDPEIETTTADWQLVLTETGLALEATACGAVLDLLDELREAAVDELELGRRIDGINRDAKLFATQVHGIADGIGVPRGEASTRLRNLRERLMASRAAAALLGSLDDEDRRRRGEVDEAKANLKAAEAALAPLMTETGSTDRVGLAASVERSRSMRGLLESIAVTERRIVAEGDGLKLDELVDAASAPDPDQIAARVLELNAKLDELNEEVDTTATAHGDARSTFAALDVEATSAVDAAADAEQAKAELEDLAEHYILKRAQAVMLKWTIEKYRERHQDPLLLRAGDLFSTLTTGRYASLRIDAEGAKPQLYGLRDDQRTVVEVDEMSEGTTDQLFLALRLAALEQSVAAGVSMPFLADDLFVNFDDQRAEAGLRVLADVAKSTQILFFTHHSHLVEIAKSVVGAELHSECVLN